MKFIAMLNKDIKPGLAVNALAQMALGLGHRFAQDGYPDVEICWGSTADVRAFRSLVAGSGNVYSDFPHTMEGGDTFSLLKGIESTPEEDLTYYASCYVAEEPNPDVSQLISQRAEQLADYTSFTSNEPTKLLPEGEHLPLPEQDNKKTTTMVNSKLPLAKTINHIVLANIDAGRRIPYSQLNLLRIGGLQGVSFNTHPVLKADSPAKHMTMTQNAQKKEGLYVSSRAISAKEPLVTVTFGEREAVESVIVKKQTRMFEPQIKFAEPKVANAPSLQVSLSVFNPAGKGNDVPEEPGSVSSLTQ